MGARNRYPFRALVDVGFDVVVRWVLFEVDPVPLPPLQPLNDLVIGGREGSWGGAEGVE